MTDSPPLPAILRDMPCGTCGYNLRGLSPDGRCPECGHPVEESRYDPRLAAADPRWLRVTRTGITLLLVSELATMTTRLLGRAVTFAGLYYHALLVLWFIGGTLYLLGSWIVASRDRACPPAFDPRRPRRVVRVCAVVEWTAMLIMTLDLFTHRLPMHLAALVLVVMMCCLPGTACMFLLLRGFARRMPAPALAWASAVLLFFVPTTAALRLGQNTVYAVLLAVGHPNPSVLYESASGHAIHMALTVAGWISLGVSVVVFFWFRRRLSAVRSQDRADHRGIPSPFLLL